MGRLVVMIIYLMQWYMVRCFPIVLGVCKVEILFAFCDRAVKSNGKGVAHVCTTHLLMNYII